MYKTSQILFLSFLLFNSVIFAQKQLKDIQTYQRSSLHNILVVGDSFDNSDIVLNAYQSWPFPDKYNDHRINLNSVNLENFTLTDQEKEKLGIKNDVVGKLFSDTASNATAGIVVDNSQVKYQLDKFIVSKKLPFQMVSKWFALDRINEENYNPTKLIQDRGLYNASVQDKKIASTTARGENELKNSGKNLIKNTFVVFTKLNFVSNEIFALAIKKAADEQANKLPAMARDIALKASEKAYTKTKEGYSVWTTAWLYRLDWTDEVFVKFKKLYKSKKSGEDIDMSDLEVNFEFIGKEKATTLVTFSLKGKRTEQEIIELSTIRNLDKVYSKLQKKYEIFRPKSPLIVKNGKYYSEIGAKEGLSGGETFDVLEAIANPETYEIMGYKKIATLKADKKQIWDNRFSAQDENPQDFNMTLFKSKSKKLSSGMLIMQKK